MLSRHFRGNSVGTERDVFHADGTGTVLGIGFISGTVNGRSGTWSSNDQVSITHNGEVVYWVVDQGTGDLAGLTGMERSRTLLNMALGAR